MYEKDSATNAFIISAALKKYSDFFNMLDPSPLGKRDLNRDLRAYLEDSPSDISLKHEIILQFKRGYPQKLEGLMSKVLFTQDYH